MLIQRYSISPVTVRKSRTRLEGGGLLLDEGVDRALKEM